MFANGNKEEDKFSRKNSLRDEVRVFATLFRQ